MIERLAKGPASVSELARPLAMSLSAVTQHLKVLEASGLVVSRKVGRVRICWIEPKVLATAGGWITERVRWEHRFGRLGEFLTGPAMDKQRRQK